MKKKKYIVTVAGTHQHIKLKNSVEEFEDYQKAESRFFEKVDLLGIPLNKVGKKEKELYTTMIGEDYCVSLDIINNND